MSRRPWPPRARIALGTALATFGADVATASSHREAPLIAADPAVDNTDVYAFVSPDEPDTVTLVANWFGLQEPNGGPNFYPWATDAHYDINIDNDGDAKADITYRLTVHAPTTGAATTRSSTTTARSTSLDDENLLFRQYYTLSVIKGGGGSKVGRGPGRRRRTPGRRRCRTTARCATRRSPTLPGGGKTYVGAADDPFFPTCGCSTCSTAATCPRSGRTRWPATTSTPSPLQVPMTAGRR